MFATVLMVALGGALGSLARFGASRVFAGVVDDAMPIATLTVNLVGCFIAGFLVRAFAGAWEVPDHMRAGLIVGVLGGLTTFSAFGVETMRMIDAGRWVWAMGFIGLNVVGGVGGVALGQAAAKAWVGAPPIPG